MKKSSYGRKLEADHALRTDRHFTAFFEHVNLESVKSNGCCCRWDTMITVQCKYRMLFNMY